MDKIVDYLSSYSSALRYEDIPADVIHQAKRIWVDTIACALGGYNSEPSKIAREVGKIMQSTQPATVLFSGEKTSMDLAAFTNGIMLRYLDYMDFIQSPTVKDAGHPSETFPAVLSPAEVTGKDGKAVLLGAVLGWEVMGRLADAANIRATGFCHCTNIGIAASCAASRMLDLSKEQTAHAIAMATNSHVTLPAAHCGHISMWKGCTAANGCRNAVFSALLASKGMTGPLEVFEGRGGLIGSLTDGEFAFEPAFGGEGRPFRIMDSSIKNYPCGSVGQSAIDCALAIRPKLSSIDDIEQINIRTFGHSYMSDGTVCNSMIDSANKWRPRTKETADHSMPYNIALALTYGGIESRYFADEYLNDPQLISLMEKTTGQVVEECTKLYPEKRLNILEIVTRSGQRFEERLAYHKGHPKNPLTDKEIEKKFRSLADGVLSQKQADAALDALWNLDQADDIGKVMNLLRV